MKNIFGRSSFIHFYGWPYVSTMKGISAPATVLSLMFVWYNKPRSICKWQHPTEMSVFQQMNPYLVSRPETWTNIYIETMPQISILYYKFQCIFHLHYKKHEWLSRCSCQPIYVRFAPNFERNGLVLHQILNDYVEEWCLLGCYAVWLL
jgi:hypothetical protein